MSVQAASERPPLLEVLQPGDKFMNRVYTYTDILTPFNTWVRP